MAYKLVCAVPMHGHKRGDAVTDKATVERLMATHNHHFVKVEIPDEPEAAEPEFPSYTDKSSTK
jgi:hypothetical protein